MSTTATLSELPPEVVELILTYVEPVDVACFSQTCRLYHSLVYDPTRHALWKSLFLAVPFDDPRRCLTSNGDPLAADTTSYDWRGELQRRIRAQGVITNTRRCRPGELAKILRVVVGMIIHTPPATVNYEDSEVSKNLLWLARNRLEEFVEFSSKLTRGEDEYAEHRQLAARLHTYFGLTERDSERADRLVNSRAFVYDMRNYSPSNNWGPFIPDGTMRVNWVHVYAIQHLMAQYIQAPNYVSPMSIPFCQAQVAVETEGVDKEDWAGIEGPWRCSFCFIDHRELIAYNRPDIPEDEPRSTEIFENPEMFDELFRFIDINLHVTATQHDPDHLSRPILKFIGTVNDLRTMAGEVHMTGEDEVRWHFESGDGDNRMWSSEGVQIGAVQSGYGILGTWTTVHHEPLDPIGPFWLRKMHGEQSKQEPTLAGNVFDDFAEEEQDMDDD